MKERQSNMELLRLVCMFFIIIHHFIIHALPLSSVYASLSGLQHDIPVLIDAVCVCAVPVFVLISGWFGIRPKLRGFLNLYVQCAFYFGILYLFFLYYSGSHVNRWCLYNTIFPFSNNPDLWFVECYVMLYFVSPLLNIFVGQANKRELVGVLSALTIICVYFGWYRQMKSSTMDGYSVLNFIYLYLIGRFLALHVNWNNVKHLKSWSLGCFCVGSLFLGLLPILNSRLELLPSWMPIFQFWMYNHPLVILNAIALVVFCSTLRFQSRGINKMAASAFAIYLLHENVYVRQGLAECVANAVDYPPLTSVRVHSAASISIGDNADSYFGRSSSTRNMLTDC